LGVVWFGLTTRTRSVGLVNTSRSGLEGAEQVPQSAGVIGLMFATVEPSGHVVAGDLPQSAVVDGDLGPGTVGCRPAGRRWCAEDEPAAAGCPLTQHVDPDLQARAARDAGPGAGRSDEGRWRRTAIPCRRCEIGSGC
jgi:hypothetical protein